MPEHLTTTSRQPGIGSAGSLRRTGSLRASGPSLRRRLALAVPVVLLASLLAWWTLWRPTTTLHDLRLTGSRGPQCDRFVIASDVSGSMDDYAAARDAAVHRLVSWLPDNLRADDEVAVVQFAGDAGSVAGPVPVGGLAASPTLQPGPPTDVAGTSLDPVLAAAGLPTTPCDTALLVISDGQVAPMPVDRAAGRALLVADGIHDLVLLVPADAIHVPAGWTVAFPEASPERFDGKRPDETATAIARAIAGVTGQRLTSR